MNASRTNCFSIELARIRISNALTSAQHCFKLRSAADRQGRLTPVACDFKCGFDRDDPRWGRLNLPNDLFAVDYSDFEQEINQLRTYQGQSDVYVINSTGTILAPTFGGGAN